MLKQVGFAKVHEEQSLAGTVLSAHNFPLDVALLDVNLTDGVSVPLADNFAAMRFPCVFMTGYPPDADDVRSRGLPVLLKPFTPAMLQDVLQKAMSIRG